MYQTGDIVIFKDIMVANQFKMTVNHCFNKNCIECIWFEGTTLFRQSFPFYLLQKLQ